MKQFFFTVFYDLGRFLFECLLPSGLIGLAVSAAYCLMLNKKKKAINRKALLKAFSLFFLSTVVILILWLTIILRIGESFDSLSNIWGNWLVIRDRYGFDFSAIENIIMLMPLPFAINYFRKVFLKKSYSVKQSVIRNTMYAFCFSAFIECTQIIFGVGMFQVSDLVYNTLGGFLGAILYLIIKNHINKKTHRQ